MPRTARVVLPAYPHHVVQRGHNRQAVFAASGDYEGYLATLAELKGVFGVKVYAWCLMTNHVHLLLEPSNANGPRVADEAIVRSTNSLSQSTGTAQWNGLGRALQIELGSD